MESENLAVKIFSEICCNGCMCTSESDHKLSNSDNRFLSNLTSRSTGSPS